MIKFRSPIYWEHKFNATLSILCQNCGVRFNTTFKKYERNKSCPRFMYKAVD